MTHLVVSMFMPFPVFFIVVILLILCEEFLVPLFTGSICLTVFVGLSQFLKSSDQIFLCLWIVPFYGQYIMTARLHDLLHDTSIGADRVYSHCTSPDIQQLQ